jgi:hypothetical protein
VLLLRREGLTQEQIQAETPASLGTRRPAERREDERDTVEVDLPDLDLDVEVEAEAGVDEEGGDDN